MTQPTKQRGQYDHIYQQELIVFGYIRRIESLLKSNKSYKLLIPSTLYYLCTEYFEDDKCFIYFQNVNNINLVNLNDTNSKDIRKYITNKHANVEQIISLNNHPNDTKNYGWCGNAYMVYNPTTSFAFIHSNVSLPNKIKNKISNYTQKQHIVLFQFGGKTWKTDVDCNAFIINKYLLQPTDQSKDLKIYRWKLSEFVMSNHFGFAYSRTVGLICLKDDKIYCLSLDAVDNEWKNNKYDSRLLKNRMLVTVGGGDSISVRFCVINNNGKDMLFIVDNTYENNTEIFDFALNNSYFGKSMFLQKEAVVLIQGIYYDNWTQRVYVILQKKYKSQYFMVQYYDIKENKWYKMEGFCLTQVIDACELCVWMKNNILYVTGINWDVIKYFDVKQSKKWMSQKMNLRFESKKKHGHVSFRVRTNQRHLLCI